eukprot:12496600-Ditylum_brightwellii.AAC.1
MRSRYYMMRRMKAVIPCHHGGVELLYNTFQGIHTITVIRAYAILVLFYTFDLMRGQEQI